MKKPIPGCEHGNEYEFECEWTLILYNGTNRIYLSKLDFEKLQKLAEKGFK